jgi:exosortase/archaeosortase family protein
LTNYDVMGNEEGTLGRLVSMLSRPKALNYMLAIGVALILAAIYTAFWSLHPSLLFEAVLMIIGAVFILMRALLTSPKGATGEKAPDQARPHRETIGERIIRKVTFENRLKPYFVVIGIALIIFDYFYNRTISIMPDLGNADYILIALAFVMIFYDRVPKRFSMERDFTFIFLVAIMVFLIIPLAILTLFIGDPDQATSSEWVHYFVSVPASFVAGLIGVQASAVYSPTAGSFITFIHADGTPGSVGIALGCSGLWSVVIFFCAYLSYLLSNHAVLERRLGVGLLLGFVMAWFANLIRIALTIGAGAWWGNSALLWFHENLGILIFLAWTALFWFILFRYIIPPNDTSLAANQAPKEDAVAPQQ